MILWSEFTLGASNRTRLLARRKVGEFSPAMAAPRPEPRAVLFPELFAEPSEHYRALKIIPCRWGGRRQGAPQFRARGDRTAAAVCRFG